MHRSLIDVVIGLIKVLSEEHAERCESSCVAHLPIVREGGCPYDQASTPPPIIQSETLIDMNTIKIPEGLSIEELTASS